MSDSNGRARQPRISQNQDEVDRFFRDFWERITTYVDEGRPTVATVTGRDGQGGNVKVHIDGEKKGRNVGIPRAKGVDFQNGDRILVQRIRGGDWGAVTPFTSGSGQDAERAVGRKQMMRQAVGPDELDNDAVKGHHIAKDSVGELQIASGIMTKINGAVSNQDLNNKLTGYLKEGALSGYAKSSELSSYAKQTKVDDLTTRIKNLETKVANLSKKKSGD